MLFFVFLYICFVSSALAAIEGVLPRCERGGELRKPSVRAAGNDQRRRDGQAWDVAYAGLEKRLRASVRVGSGLPVARRCVRNAVFCEFACSLVLQLLSLIII